MKNSIQKFGKFLSAMVMPNIGAFIAWGFITALFIEAGWIPNERLATLVDPMLKYLIPTLIAFQGGRMVGGDRGGVMGAVATLGVIAGSEQTMLIGAMAMGPFAGLIIKKFDKAVEGKIPAGFEMLVNNFSAHQSVLNRLQKQVNLSCTCWKQTPALVWVYCWHTGYSPKIK